MSTNERERLQPGTVLDDRFEIVRLLGGGGFGDVYLAKQVVFGRVLRQVALKIFHSQVSPENMYEVFAEPVHLWALKEEVSDEKAARHLIDVYDIGVLHTPAPRAFMSMPLISEPANLARVIGRYRDAGGMPVMASVNYLRQILAPLEWMHRLAPPLAHGDLKPENLLMQADWTLVLTDFGLAARMPLGVYGGTLPYQAAESITGNPATLANDVFAVGIIWYEMLTGRNPYENVGLEAAADDAQALREAHLEARKWPLWCDSGSAGRGERLASPAKVNPEFGDYPRLAEILAQCLRYRQSARYNNARLLSDDLRRCLPDDEAPTPGSTTRPAPAVTAVTPAPAAGSSVKDARSLIRQGQAAQALAEAEAVLAHAPAELAWSLIRIEALAALKRFDAAEQFVREARKAAPEEPDVLDTWAVVQEAQDRPDGARRSRDSAARLRQKQLRPTTRGG